MTQIDDAAVNAQSTDNNVASMFFERVSRSPDLEAFRYRHGDSWASATWSESAARVTSLAAGLLALGIQPEDRVAIASSTRFEWVLADLAILCAGAATTTVYPSTHAADTAFIVADSGSRIVFAEDESQVAKLTEQRGELPLLSTIVVFDGPGNGTDVITLDELAQIGDSELSKSPEAVTAAASAIRPDRVATVIYTSGTTGKPKGVRLSHRAWTYTAEAVKAQGLLDENDVNLLWLPLAHAFGKALLAVQLACGYVNVIDGRVDKIVSNSAEVQPTFMAAVPRIFEKAYSSVAAAFRGDGGPRAEAFDDAFEVGLEVCRLRRSGEPISDELRRRHDVADETVFSSVRSVFGGKLRYFISGSAPLNKDIAEWFEAAGLLILEGYGLTESSGAGFVNMPDNYKLGTVGVPFEGTEVRIGDNGEVELRGPLIMDGYHELPDATKATFTKDGWFLTGDRGTVDADGFLTITGRIKELFKTSGGKYVVPPAIEAKFISLCPLASQFMVFGEARNFCSALIVLDGEAVSGWAAQNGLTGSSYTDVIKLPTLLGVVERYVEQLNKSLNRWETIKKWSLMDHELSVENGELTPSLKVKRTVVANQQKDILDAFYS